jgi:hypothetical protein
MLKDKPIPIVKTYESNTLATLHFAYNINENREFGEMKSLTMKVPYYQYNSYNEIVRDQHGKAILNYNIFAIKNEMIIDFNDNLYLIKKVSPLRTGSGKKYIEISCEDKAIELSYKNISYLVMNAPVFNPVMASTAIINLLSAKFELDNGNPQAVANNTITLRSGTTITGIVGKKICITDGTGQGQDRRITGYDSVTKIVTVDANWITNPDTSSSYRIHYSKWTLGNVESQFLNDGVNDIYRGYEFKDITMSKALKEVASKMDGFITYNYVYSDTYGEYINYINLVSPNTYNNVEIRYKKNLLSVKKTTETIENIYTRLFPYGVDNLSINNIATETRIDNGTTYNTHTDGQSYIENYQYYLGLGYDIDFCRENFVNDYEFNNTSYTNDDDLYTDAKRILDKSSQPKITYEVNAIDLSVLTGFDYEEFDIGDTIRVVDNELNINVDAVIKSKNINWDSPQKSSFELTNFVENLGDYIYRIINGSNQYTDTNKVFGKNTTYIISDKITSKNWKYADYFVDIENGIYLEDIMNPIINDMQNKGTSGKIIILEGEYQIRNWINFQTIDNTTIEGQGADTKIIASTAVDSLSLSMIEFNGGNNSRIQSLTFDGTNMTNGCRAIRMIGSDNSTIRDVSISNCYDHGIYAGSCNNLTMSEIVINNIAIGGSGESIGIEASSTSESLFNNISISNTLSHAIEDNYTSVDNKYINCTITNNNNGLRFDGVGTVLNNSTISENSIGLWAEGSLLSVSNNTFAGNTSSLGAIYASGGTDVRYSNNYLSENNVGIQIGLTESCVLESNYFINNLDRAVTMLSTNKIKVQNNTFKNNNDLGAEQVLVYGDNNTFDGNTVRGNTDYSIDVNGSTNLIINNDFTDGYTIAAIDSGTGDILGQNRT